MSYPTLKEAIAIARNALEKLPEVQRVIFGAVPALPLPADLEDDETTLFIRCVDVLADGTWYLLSREHTDLCEAVMFDEILLQHGNMKRIE